MAVGFHKKQVSDLPDLLLETLKLINKENWASSCSVVKADEPWEKKHKRHCVSVSRTGMSSERRTNTVGGRELNGGEIFPYTSSRKCKLFIQVS